MATIKDVAALAEVSISTVSNVLNQKKYVSPETSERVYKAVNDLNFHLDTTARNMRAKRSMMIGVVLPSVTRVFYSQVLAGMNEAANKVGYSIVLYSAEYDFAKEKKFVHDLVRNKVDGIIIASLATEEDDDYLESLSKLRNGKKSIYVVSLGKDLSAFGLHSIAWDDRNGTQMAIQSMIDHGATKIVCMSSGQQRFAGYHAALKSNNIPFDPELCIQGDASAWGGYSATNRLLNDGVLFDGLFAGNDQRAVGAIKAIQEHGLRIPEDVQVVGFDNSFVSSLIQPPLTTVNVPKRRLGREAVCLILQLQEAENEGNPVTEAQRVLLPLQLVERASTNRDRHTTWELEDW